MMDIFIIRIRYTPTCVGTMKYIELHSAQNTVHPHMRGDHRFSSIRNFPSNGTPPHAWGPLIICNYMNIIKRYTPTCVGTMLIMSISKQLTSVHPHMRGDHNIIINNKLIKDGTPPHAWGP